MAKKDYIPGEEGMLIKWLANFKSKIAAYAAVFNLNSVQVTALENFCQALIDKLNANYQAQADAQQARADADTQKVTSVTELRKAAQLFKKMTGYTPAIGEDLKIIGDEQSIDVNTSQPKLKTRRVETGWEISFNLKGFFEAVKIYRQRPGGAKTFLTIDTANPYIDTEEQVNGTAYTAWYMLSNETVGVESDEAVVQV